MAEYSAEHKLAMAEGRERAKAVRSYLDYLEERGPGRKRNPETIEKRLAAIEENIGLAGSLERLKLMQEHANLCDELDALRAGGTVAELEAGFLAHAKDYGEQNGITYKIWRQFGVPAPMLKGAGIYPPRKAKAVES